MTLQPGETTNLSLKFMMAGNEGGPHYFLIHLPNNDTKQKDATVSVLSNWVP
jgi:hypothetical protein